MSQPAEAKAEDTALPADQSLLPMCKAVDKPKEIFHSRLWSTPLLKEKFEINLQKIAIFIKKIASLLCL